uniref:Serine/threonine-protein phosphatase 2A 55 kDa regulatory subunit B n=1 Tax=Cyprinus carpio carpio TaxID=630221 RepID=A0A8C1BRR3_CYPCA
MLSPVLCSDLAALEPEYTEADVISTVEFNQSGEFLATGDRGGRVVIFQREPQGEYNVYSTFQSHEPEFDYLKSLEIEEKINKIRWLPLHNPAHFLLATNDKTIKLWKVSERDKRAEGYNLRDEEGRLKDLSTVTTLQGEYNVYSTFQSHEPEFDYLKSLEIEEKINKIRWLPLHNPAHFLLATNDKTIKLWKVSERDKRAEGYNLRDEEGRLKDLSTVTTLQVPVLRPMDLLVEASPRRVFANGHAYHINSISVNSDCETYLSADDLRINLWHLNITDRSFNIVDLKPENMEDLSEVITVAEFHPHHCHLLAFSSSTGTTRLCDMRARALCDQHAKLFEEAVDPSRRSFFSEIVSSVSDVKFSHSGRYLLTRDYLTVKVWDLNMENKPVETYQVHDYLRTKLCSLYESDCIFDKFECAWNGTDSVIMTGAYNNYFRMFDRASLRDVTLEASREVCKRRAVLQPRRVCVGKKRKETDVSVDSLDFRKKILHTAWHPKENIIAIAASNNLYIFQDRLTPNGHHNTPEIQSAPPKWQTQPNPPTY